MSNASDYSENEIADWIGANGAPGAVANTYVKLHIGAPGENGTSNPAAETDRVEATFDPASGGVVALTATVSWTSVAATETYTHFSLWDNISAGNCLGWGALTGSVPVNAGDNFDLTALTITVT